LANVEASLQSSKDSPAEGDLSRQKLMAASSSWIEIKSIELN
jgi:hypothetical protein